MSDLRCVVCGRPVLIATHGRHQTDVCTYWCALVKKGSLTLEQVEPMLDKIRGPRPGAA